MVPPANIPPGLSVIPVNHHVIQIQQKMSKSPISVECTDMLLSRPGLAAFLCPAWVTPMPGHLHRQSLSCPPSADKPGGTRTSLLARTPGMVPNSSSLDKVPEINHSSLKSHSGPLFLLENTPGSSFESWGDRPRLLCSVLHKIAISGPLL